MKKKNDDSQSNFFQFENLKPFTIHHQLGMLEGNRKRLFEELLENLDKKTITIDDKKKLCRVYMYETIEIDKKINEIRQIMLNR